MTDRPTYVDDLDRAYLVELYQPVQWFMTYLARRYPGAISVNPQTGEITYPEAIPTSDETIIQGS